MFHSRQHHGHDQPLMGGGGGGTLHERLERGSASTCMCSKSQVWLWLTSNFAIQATFLSNGSYQKEQLLTNINNTSTTKDSAAGPYLAGGVGGGGGGGRGLGAVAPLEIRQSDSNPQK